MINANELRDVIIQTLQGTKHEDDPQTKFAEAVAKYYKDNLTLGGIYIGTMPPPASTPDPLSGSYTIKPLSMSMNPTRLKNAAKNGFNAWYLEIINQIHNFTFNPAAGEITLAGTIKPFNGFPIPPVIKNKTDFEEIMGIVASCIIRDTVTLPPKVLSFTVISSSGGTGNITITGYQ